MKALILVVVLLMLSVVATSAEMYKWVDENGSIHFSDKRPPDKAVERFQPLKDHCGEKNEESSRAENVVSVSRGYERENRQAPVVKQDRILTEEEQRKKRMDELNAATIERQKTPEEIRELRRQRKINQRREERMRKYGF